MSTMMVDAERIDSETGEVKGRGQLALFDGFVVEKATLHVTAGVEISMALSKELILGAEATITVGIGSRSITCEAIVTKRGFALEKGQDGDRVPVTRHVLVADGDVSEIER